MTHLRDVVLPVVDGITALLGVRRMAAESHAQR